MRKPRPRATAVDAHVGKRLRMQRTLLGMSQTVLGDALGITFQQIQKYENGSNRIGASRLYELTKVLDVPVGYFYEDLPEDLGQAKPSKKRASQKESQGDFMNKRETLELVRGYYKIEDAGIRNRVRELLRAMAENGSGK
jgi:transcriptional regulator with XRE-family HTH domain